MSETKRLLKNTGIIAIGNLSTKLISFLLLPLYTALLSTEDYGTVDFLTTCAIFMVPFVSLVMDEAVFRFLVDCRTEVERKRVFSLTFGIVLGGAALFVLVGNLAFAAIGLQYRWFLITYVILLVFSGLIGAFFRGTNQMKLYSAFNFVTSGTTIVLNVLLIAVCRMGLVGMLIATLGGLAVSEAIFFFVGQIYRGISLRQIRWAELKPMIVYAVPLIPNRISWYAVSLINRLLIVNLLGQGMNGLYALAMKFSTFINTFYGFFYQSWMESAARMQGETGADAVAYYDMMYSHVKRVMLSVVLCVIAVLPYMFAILVNESFAQAITLVPILLLSVYFDSLSCFLGGVFTAYKDTKIMGKTTAIAALISCAVSAVMMPRLGVISAALATMLSYILAFGGRRVAVRAHCQLQTQRGWTLGATACCALVLGLFYSGNAMLRLAMIPVAGGFALVSNRALLKMLWQKGVKRQ